MKEIPRGYARDDTQCAGRAPDSACHPESPGTPEVRDLLRVERGLGPTLVLLPGLDGTGELFAPFLQSLGAALPAQVVAYPRDQALGYAQLEPLVRAALPTNRQA